MKCKVHKVARGNLKLLGCLGAALTIAGAAHAQPALDEIIVTAEKREESLQDVPIAVSAYSSEFLEDRQISSINGLEKYTPNLRIENAPNNTTASQVAIRGGVTINPALTWEPTVGMYLNGVYIGKTQGSVFDVADIERMEVLRGPQGTLYGRNTLAGAINIITKKPSDVAGVSAELGIGNENRRHAKITADFGSMGKVRTKLSTYMIKRDGFVKSSGPGPDREHENIDRISALLAVSVDATDNLTIDYTYDYSKADQNPPYSQVVSVAENNIFDPNSPLYAFGGAFFPLDQYTFPNRQENVQIDNDVEETSDISGHTLSFEYAMDNMTLKSITGYRELDWVDDLDIDGSPLLVAHTARDSEYESLSQEFQLIGNTDRTNYVVGLYYFEDDGYTNNPQLFFGGGESFDSQYGFETEAIAVYAQLDYALTDTITVKAGLRYTEEDKTIERTSIVLASANPAFPAGTPFPLTVIPAGTTASTSFDDLAPQISFEYAAAENINLYAKYAKGFKSGGFNGEAGTIAETTAPYEAETVNSFELGAKMRLMENRLQLNTAIFSNEHEDMQLSIFLATGAAESLVRNAGKATINGLEIEALYLLNEDTLLRFNYGYLDSEYDEYIDFAGANVADNRALPHAPENTLGVGIDIALADTAWGSWKLIADYQYVDEYFTYPYSLDRSEARNAYNTQVDSRGIIDASLVLSDIPFGDQNMKLTLWGKNIGDEEYIANYIDFGPAFGGLTTGYFGEPMTYGLTASMKW